MTNDRTKELLRAERRHPVPDDALTCEPSQRWVRALVGDVTVVDSRAPMLVWEPGSAMPMYVFPRRDVRSDLLRPSEAPPRRPRPGARQFYDLVVPGAAGPLAAIAWDYDAPELDGHLAIEWFGRRGAGIDHWYEEDEEIFVHPRDPYKRVDAIASSRHVEVSIGGVIVADSRRPVLVYETRLPTRYYLPVADVRMELFTPIETTTRCPYKGVARYWAFTGGAERVNDVLWSYPDPTAATAAIRDRMSFYNEIVDITVDGVDVGRPYTEFSNRFPNGTAER